MPADGKIRFPCPGCGKTVSVTEAHTGKRGKCPACGQSLQVPAAEPAPDFDSFLALCMEELRVKTAAHDGIWQLGEADWDIDQDAGTIVFTSPKGVTATCPVQVIGTYNTLDGTWLWGWDHPSVDTALGRHAELCRTYGEQHGVDSLTSRKLSDVSEDECWKFTALACKLADVQGGYRGPMDTTLVFVTFGQPTLKKVKRGGR